MVAPTPELLSASNAVTTCQMAIDALRSKLRDIKRDIDYPHIVNSDIAKLLRERDILSEQLDAVIKRLDATAARKDIPALHAQYESGCADLEILRESLVNLRMQHAAIESQQKTAPVADKLQEQMAMLPREELEAMLRSILAQGDASNGTPQS